MSDDELIVTKTDVKGRIAYANDVFLRISAYSEAEVLGKPHSIVRHPDMPRAVFGLLWERIESGREIFAYVKNLARDGAHYWVFANITPTVDRTGAITGYHSNRRAPHRPALEPVRALYAELAGEEANHSNARAATAAGRALLERRLAERGQSYDEFVWSLEPDAAEPPTGALVAGGLA